MLYLAISHLRKLHDSTILDPSCFTAPPIRLVLSEPHSHALYIHTRSFVLTMFIEDVPVVIQGESEVDLLDRFAEVPHIHQDGVGVRLRRRALTHLTLAAAPMAALIQQF